MFSFQVVACKASRLNQLLIWYRSSIVTICLVSSFNLEIIFLYVQTTTLQKNVVCMWLLLTNKSYIHPFLFLVPSDNHQLSHSHLCGFPTSLFSAPSADSHRGTFSTKHSIRPNDNDDTSAVRQQWRLRDLRSPSNGIITNISLRKNGGLESGAACAPGISKLITATSTCTHH